MRTVVLSFTMLTVLAVTPALAQMQQGYGAAPGNMPTGGADSGGALAEAPGPVGHQPMSRRATNINGQDTRSQISPSLPRPPVGTNADATQFLQAAQNALSRNRTGQAQAALENAETYLLDRSVPQGMTNQPDQSPVVQNVSAALQALASGDRQRSMDLIQQAIPLAQQYEAAMQGGAGMAPGMAYGMQPGMQQGMQPGMPPGMQPGMQQGMQPGMQQGMPPAMNGYQGGPPGSQAGMAPGGYSPGMPMQPASQPGTPGYQGGYPGGYQPGMSGAQPGTGYPGQPVR